jgi:hypothetical protein
VFFIHYKYSAILNNVFIAMVFGTSMPLLFPIAAASLMIFYYLETYMLYYAYRRPPEYDVKLNDYVLRKLAWAPFFMLCFSYWMLSNPALNGRNSDEEEIEVRTDSDVPANFKHYWFKVFNLKWVIQSGPSALLFFAALAYYFYLMFSGLFLKIIGKCTNNGKKCGECLKIWFDQDVEVDEVIPDYDEALSPGDRLYSMAEEINLRVYGLQSMLQSSWKKIEEVENKEKNKKTLQGVHTYDLLRNPAYIQAFQYYSADLADRDHFIIDDDDSEDNNNVQSDYVRVLLSLAYI